jgi:hypothetical protein
MEVAINEVADGIMAIVNIVDAVMLLGGVVFLVLHLQLTVMRGMPKHDVEH